MKSAEAKSPCPACHQLVGRDWMNQHIAQQANKEKKSRLQVEKKHYNYKLAH